jgi:translation elongation factor EF-1beta
MNRVECKIEELPKEIKNTELFEFRFKYNYKLRLSEAVSNIAFGDNKMYITIIDWSDDNYNMLDELTQEIISQEIEVALADRNGNILCLFEFENCVLKDVAPIILDYCGNFKTPKSRYIVTIEYSKIYKTK